MKYVKITAKSFNDAMMKMKMEYGEDAIPISHKNIKEGGLLKSKLFAHDIVELTVAIPEKGSSRNAPQKKQAKSSFDVLVGDRDFPKASPPSASASSAATDLAAALSAVKAAAANSDKSAQMPKETYGGNNLARPASPMPDYARNERVEPVAVRAQEKPVADVRDKEELSQLTREFGEIKDTLRQLMEQRDVNRDYEPRHQSGAVRADDPLRPFDQILRNNDYDDDERSNFIEEVRNTISREDMKDRFKIEKSFKDILKMKVLTSGPIKAGNRKKVIMFVGPTGVGKTTTMAKMGAMFALQEGRKVSFVTIDNYRIAATEQLKKYAEIMRIPIHAVNDQKEFKEVLEKEKAEIILVDTSGRSPRNTMKISEIKSYADLIEYDVEKILCVSASTKKCDLDSVFKAFEKIDYRSVIITKVDETSFIGNVLTVADKYKKPISYFTSGQEVPNDISVADAGKLVDMVMGESDERQ